MSGNAKVKKDADPFATFKWDHLEQVALDKGQPPICSRIAILITSKFLSRRLGTAWPAVDTIAKMLNIKAGNTVRTALKTMEQRGHYSISWSKGGRAQTSIITPLVAGKPFKKLENIDGGISPKSKAETFQKSARKPVKNLKGNPLNEPFEEEVLNQGDGPSEGVAPRPNTAEPHLIDDVDFCNDISQLAGDYDVPGHFIERLIAHQKHRGITETNMRAVFRWAATGDFSEGSFIQLVGAANEHRA